MENSEMTQSTPLANGSSPHVARAAKLDAAGKHADAINALVAGVRSNDVEAITRLGKRLLVGDRAPHLPNDGASFLVDASRRGSAEAAAQLAVLYALGTSSEHGLAAALENLVLAAERGWQPAQGQLAVLGGYGVPSAANTAPSHWHELGKRIDLNAWQAPATGGDLSAEPRIRLFADLVDDNVCTWLIERAQGRLSRALVYDALAKTTTENPTRTNTAAVFNLLDADFVCVLVQLRMAASLGKSIRYFEPITVLHYDEGEQITEHYDFVDPNVPDYQQEIAQKGQRVVTFLIYLNDGYQGGETEFPRSGVSHKGRRREGLYFVNALPDGSADIRTLHAGRPPRDGEKWIVSQFVRDRPLF
jgi:hypothetical protein